jgi:hypothetical protein
MPGQAIVGARRVSNGVVRRSVLILVMVALPAVARADEPSGDLLVDAGLVVAMPTGMPTGTSTGVGAGVTKGGAFQWGARAAWASATEYTRNWTVAQDDLRLRGIVGLAHAAGRGSFALRLGLGTTLIHEVRDRAQGQRAGLTGSELQTTEWGLVAASDLELALALRVEGPWVFVLSGGPSVSWYDSVLHAGWVGGVGVAWRP